MCICISRSKNKSKYMSAHTRMYKTITSRTFLCVHTCNTCIYMFLYMYIKENTFTHIFGHNIYMHNSYNARIIVLQAGQEIEKGQEIEEKQRLALSAAHWNVLQHTATYCNTLQHTATKVKTRMRHAATHCNKLQHTTTRVKLQMRHAAPHLLQNTAARCNTMLHTVPLQHAATRCNTLQHLR